MAQQAPADKTQCTVRDLGRKARARLLEEQNKRPEIQILSPNDAKGSDGDSARNESRRVLLHPAATRKRRRLSTPRTQRTRIKKGNSLNERWMPNVNTVTELQAKGKPSAYVQLHGVPTSTTTAILHRFLSGLDPFSFWLVLFPPIHIPALDASNSTFPDYVCQRHLRIFVQLSSPTVAHLAIQRSGESTVNSNNPIVITAVSKPIARGLVERIGVPWCTNGSTVAVAQEEIALEPSVPHILWASVEREIRGLLGPHDTTSWAGNSPFGLKDCGGPTVSKPLSESELKRLSERQTLMETEAKRLQRAIPIAAHDKSIHDPAASLTQACIEILFANSNRISRILAVSQGWAWLKELASSVLPESSATKS